MNISNKEIIERILFGVARLKEEKLTQEEQSKIFRALGSICKMRSEQLLQVETENG